MKFLLPYKWRVVFLFVGTILFGMVNNAIAAMTGVFVMLFSSGVPQQNPLSAMLAGKLDKYPAIWSLVLQIDQHVDKTSLFYIAVTIFVALVVAVSVFNYFEAYFGYWLSTRVGIDLREFVMRRLLEKDLAFFKRRAYAQTVTNVNSDVTTTQQAMFTLITLATRPLLVVIGLSYVMWLNWQLTLVSLIGIPIAAISLRKVGKKVRQTGEKSWRDGVQVAQAMLQFIQGIATVKAFGCEQFEFNNFHKYNEKSFTSGMRNMRATCAERPITSLTSKFGVLLVFLISGKMIVAGALSPADLMSFMVALSFMYSPGKEISRANMALNVAAPSMSRVFELLDIQVKVQEGARELASFTDTIEFSKINFGYEEDRQVIHDLSLSVKKGERIALVGVSGSGKTTLLNLLLRLYDIDTGEIKIDQLSIKEYSFASLRGQMALVSQVPFLFRASIRENISYGQNTINDDQVIAVAKAANLHDEILRLPDGYDTIISDNGGDLSGGQRQRLCIARALYKNAPILLLDEATSALDSENEAKIQSALEILMAGRTSITIAHRLATVRDSDRIIMLQNGRIIGNAPHEELLATCPEYKKLVDMQQL